MPGVGEQLSPPIQVKPRPANKGSTVKVSETEVEKLVVETETAAVERVEELVVTLERKVVEAVDRKAAVVTAEKVLATEVVTVAAAATLKQPILLRLSSVKYTRLPKAAMPYGCPPTGGIVHSANIPVTGSKRPILLP